jgi:predicted nucleic acid-binding protein
MNVEIAYIDTSVLGAYYCPEPISDQAEQALNQVEVPVLSSLSEVEFHSLVSKKRRLKELTARQTQAVRDLFENHLAAGVFRRISLSGEHFLKARHLVSVTGNVLRTLDALHLAAAIAESLPIVTADPVLAGAARRERTRVILVKAAWSEEGTNM